MFFFNKKVADHCCCCLSQKLKKKKKGSICGMHASVAAVTSSRVVPDWLERKRRGVGVIMDYIFNWGLDSSFYTLYIYEKLQITKRLLQSCLYDCNIERIGEGLRNIYFDYILNTVKRFKLFAVNEKLFLSFKLQIIFVFFFFFYLLFGVPCLCLCLFGLNTLRFWGRVYLFSRILIWGSYLTSIKSWVLSNRRIFHDQYLSRQLLYEYGYAYYHFIPSRYRNRWMMHIYNVIDINF